METPQMWRHSDVKISPGPSSLPPYWPLYRRSKFKIITIFSLKIKKEIQIEKDSNKKMNHINTNLNTFRACWAVTLTLRRIKMSNITDPAFAAMTFTPNIKSQKKS